MEQNEYGEYGTKAATEGVLWPGASGQRWKQELGVHILEGGAPAVGVRDSHVVRDPTDSTTPIDFHVGIRK